MKEYMEPKETDYHKIYQHYEECLEKYGDSHKGLDWPNIEGMTTRFKIMSDVVKEDSCQLLDVGCGTGAFYSYLKTHKPQITYTGLDISEKFIQLCRTKYPDVPFMVCDIIDPIHYNNLQMSYGKFDYAIMNGLFTAKYSLSYDQMFEFLKAMLKKVFQLVNKGIAFNVMSKHLNHLNGKERKDLFHLPYDTLAEFITKELGQIGMRGYQFRSDYGLYEYTTYIYK